MRIEAIEKELIEEFELFGDDWEARYEYLIDMGKELKPLNETLKTDNNLIKGCQSRVWLHSELQNENIIFNADSDAAIPKKTMIGRSLPMFGTRFILALYGSSALQPVFGRE